MRHDPSKIRGHRSGCCHDCSSLAVAREHSVKQSEVPEAVLKSITAKYPQGEMKRFVREIEHGKTAYEIQLDLGGS